MHPELVVYLHGCGLPEKLLPSEVDNIVTPAEHVRVSHQLIGPALSHDCIAAHRFYEQSGPVELDESIVPAVTDIEVPVGVDGHVARPVKPAGIPAELIQYLQ